MDYKLELLNVNNQNSNGVAVNFKDFDERAVFNSSQREKIFSIKAKDDKVSNRRHVVVKITNKRNGITIYRKGYFSGNQYGITNNQIGLNYNSMWEIQGQLSEDVSVSKGNNICFYWQHPFHATRISFRLGFISIILTIIGIIITIIK